MKGYGVHLLFHVLALAVGAGMGVAGALWWLDHTNTALWLALAAVVGGVLLLTMQAFYIAASEPAPPPRPVAPRRRPAPTPPTPSSTRAPAAPTTAPRPRPVDTSNAHTAIQSEPIVKPDPEEEPNEEPRSPAMEALKEHQQQGG